MGDPLTLTICLVVWISCITCGVLSIRRYNREARIEGRKRREIRTRQLERELGIGQPDPPRVTVIAERYPTASEMARLAYEQAAAERANGHRIGDAVLLDVVNGYALEHFGGYGACHCADCRDARKKLRIARYLDR